MVYPQPLLFNSRKAALKAAKQLIPHAPIKVVPTRIDDQTTQDVTKGFFVKIIGEKPNQYSYL